MARNIDLTEKLGMEGKPTITIGETVLEVNNGAANVLRLMELVADSGDMDPSDMMKAAEILFGKDGCKAIEKMALTFEDYATVLSAAMDLVTGSAEGEAEATPATTS